MSDQQPTEPVEPPAGPEGTPGTTEPQIDWEKRYNDLRPEFDRTKQRASEYERRFQGLDSDDEQTRLQALRDLGFELADDTDPNAPPPSELDTLRKELEDLKQFRSTYEQQSQQERETAQLEAIATRLQDQIAGFKDVPEHARDWVYAHALSSDHLTPEGLPDVEAAREKYRELITAEKQAWAQSKQAPHVSSVGTSGTEAPDLDDPAARIAWMTQRAAELGA